MRMTLHFTSLLDLLTLICYIQTTSHFRIDFNNVFITFKAVCGLTPLYFLTFIRACEKLDILMQMSLCVLWG